MIPENVSKVYNNLKNFKEGIKFMNKNYPVRNRAKREGFKFVSEELDNGWSQLSEKERFLVLKLDELDNQIIKEDNPFIKFIA